LAALAKPAHRAVVERKDRRLIAPFVRALVVGVTGAIPGSPSTAEWSVRGQRRL